MFLVELSNNAKKGFDSCPSDYKAKIKETLAALKESSCPFRLYDVKKIQGRDNVYRIRIGKYRIQYEVFKDQELVLVFSIGLRDETSYK